MNKELQLLLIEDSADDCELILRQLRKAGLHFQHRRVDNAEDLAKAMEHGQWDLILSDHYLPQFSSIEALEIIHKYALEIPFIIVSGGMPDELAVEAMKQGCHDYISKAHLARLPAAVSRELQEAELRKTYQIAKRELEMAFFDLAETIARVVELKDPYTAGHQRRVAELARRIGSVLKFNQKDLDTLYFAGLLHDVGKVNIANDILSKPTPLSKLEFMIIQQHPQTGFEIIRNTRLPYDISDIIVQHHEKLDGSGYPNGIMGDEIGLLVRIITVCDVVEAMSTFRPYRPARTREEVLWELREGSGVKYDAEVVGIMLDLLETQEFNPWQRDDATKP